MYSRERILKASRQVIVSFVDSLRIFTRLTTCRRNAALSAHSQMAYLSIQTATLNKKKDISNRLASHREPAQGIYMTVYSVQHPPIMLKSADRTLRLGRISSTECTEQLII